MNRLILRKIDSYGGYGSIGDPDKELQRLLNERARRDKNAILPKYIKSRPETAFDRAQRVRRQARANA